VSSRFSSGACRRCDELGIVPVQGDLALDLLDGDAQGGRHVEERPAAGHHPRCTAAGDGEDERSDS
jgi:hypothetical protein